MDISIYAKYDLGTSRKEWMQDYAWPSEENDDPLVETAGGLQLYIGMVCDGVSNAEWGVKAAFESTQTTIQYIRQSTETDIPTLLQNAVQAANQHVYQTVPKGNSTLAMFAIHVNEDDPHGRLYIASVGDSPIFLMRTDKEGTNPRRIRLNIDHNHGTDMLREGNITPEQFDYLDNAYALTQAIGIEGALDVDIGFYTNGVATPPETAHKRGRVGLKLQTGDMVVVCSDGLTDIGEDGQPFVSEDKFLRHATDASADNIGKALMAYAQQRTDDNIAVSIAVIPAPYSSDTSIEGTGGVPRWAIGLTALMAIVICGLMIAFWQTGITNRAALAEAEATRVQVAGIITSTANAQATIDSYTPTPTRTPTPLPTATPTPLPTDLPEFDPDIGAIGAILTRNQQGLLPVREDDPVSINVESYVALDGGVASNQPANLFVRPDSRLEVDDISNSPPSLELLFAAGSNFFLESGPYAAGGVTLIYADDRNLRFEGQTTCFSVRATTPNRLDVACYGEQPCTLPDDSTLQNQQASWQINTNQPADIQPISLTDAEAYHVLIEELTGVYSQGCLRPFADQDNDGLRNTQDECPTDGLAASVPRLNGCPDLDLDADGFPDPEDACPSIFGSDNGCPPDF